MDEQTQEQAYFDFLNAREAALLAAVGALVVDNVPADRLRIIAGSAMESTLALAARVALHHRGERV